MAINKYKSRKKKSIILKDNKDKDSLNFNKFKVQKIYLSPKEKCS